MRYELPALHFAEDTYHVTAAVHPVVGAEWHRLDRSAPSESSVESTRTGSSR